MFECEGAHMKISYKKLWKLLIDKGMTATNLRKATDIAPNTMTRIRKNQEVSLIILEKSISMRFATMQDMHR